MPTAGTRLTGAAGPSILTPSDRARRRLRLAACVAGALAKKSMVDMSDAEDITGLLRACSNGDTGAFDRLIPLVYDDLRVIARHRLSAERADHTLDTTGIVHEAYLRLVHQASATWRDRAHFFAISSKVIRNLLIDHARERRAKKRGGGAIHVPLADELNGDEPRTIDLLALDEALAKLGEMDDRLERVVECRFFGGLSMQETAEALGTSLRTVERDWRRARAYLFEALS